MFSGCISFRSNIEGIYTSSAEKNYGQTPVSVCFYFSHLEQEKGYDAVPKIVYPLHSFQDIFSESIKEFTNIKSFVTFTENAEDINEVSRRHKRDSLRSVSDYTIHVSIKKENSFGKRFLADLLSYTSLTCIPVGYTWDYIVTTDVYNSSGKLLKSYKRTSALNTWSHAVFLFAYPFYASHGVTEEIYFESLRDIFKQIDGEGILNKQTTN